MTENPTAPSGVFAKFEPSIDLDAAARRLVEQLLAWRASVNLSPPPRARYAADVEPALEELRQVLALRSGLEVSIAPAELARRWGVHAATVRRLIESGELPAFNAASGTVPRWRVPESIAARFVLERSTCEPCDPNSGET